MKPYFDDIFYNISRLIIIVAILIIIVTVMIKVFNNDSQLKNVTSSDIAQKNRSPQLDKLIMSKISSSEARLDFTGPWVCTFNENNATISAYIKNKNIFVNADREKNTENILVKDDCLYRWNRGEYKGDKVCNISTFTSMLDLLSKSGMIDFREELSKIIPSSKIEQLDFSKICTKREIGNNYFVIPNNVLFKNANMPIITP